MPRLVEMQLIYLINLSRYPGRATTSGAGTNPLMPQKKNFNTCDGAI
jgi:hypothetical protein